MRRATTLTMIAAFGLLAAFAPPSSASPEIRKTPVIAVSPKQLEAGVGVYLSARITASPTGANRPPPIVIGKAPQTFHCAISDMAILQSGRQPATRNGSRACSVHLEDNLWLLRARNVQMGYKEGLNTRVECQAICMETPERE